MKHLNLKLIFVLSTNLFFNTVLGNANDEVCEVAHIVSFGRTGSGKSWMGNLLTLPDTFKEGDTLESTTTVIQSALAWNQDIYDDVPGYFDTEGRDSIQQANFVDFLKGKNIRAILFLFTDKLDYFASKALESFQNSDLKNNVILISNKDLSERSVEIDDYKGYPLFYIKAFQNDINVLKRYIETKTPVKPTHLITPISLFKSPLQITGTEEIREYIKDEKLAVKETVTTTREVRVNEPFRGRRRWHGGAGAMRDNWVTRTLTDTNEIMVDKLHKVYHVSKLTYAERFDGKHDLYQKDFLRAETTLA